MRNILAIDPGDVYSGYVVVDNNMKPIEFGKVINEELYEQLPKITRRYIPKIAIEMVACYGMAVGKTVFDTCVWIGRFTERCGFPVTYIYRKDEKMTICGSMKAKDSNIRQALIDKYAKFDFKNGKGTKGNPDWFYGFKADVWAAYAVAETFRESGSYKSN